MQRNSVFDINTIYIMETKQEIKRYMNDVKDLPLWLKYTIAILTILSITWGIYVGFKPTESTQGIISNPMSNNATSTINISDIFTKAVKLDSVLERQDFLKKYIGSKIYGKGSVTEVSRYGDGYLIDTTISGQLVSCFLDYSEENEKRVLLLKDKTVNFFGTFTFTNIFDHGLFIDDCVL